MTEHFDEVQDGDGNVVCRIVHNPEQPPQDTRHPWWLELADGYQVYRGKQGCHDRSQSERKKVGRK